MATTDDEGGPGWAAVARDGVIYMRVRGVFTREIVDATRRLHVVALRQRPAGCGILFDAGTSLSLPPADVRDYAAKMAARYPDGIKAHVTVLSGTGFFGAAIRSAITGIFLVARNPYPRTVVGTVPEAIHYLRDHMAPNAIDEGTMMQAFWALPGA
jgi:hypothetical protein